MKRVVAIIKRQWFNPLSPVVSKVLHGEAAASSLRKIYHRFC